MRAAQAQPPHDVLHADDRVVDHDADRHDQAGEDHGVDLRAAQVENDDGRDERQRDRDQADERGAPLEQERHEDQDDQEAADQQRNAEVVDRELDEARGPEDVRVDRDAGKPGLQVAQRVLDALRHFQRVGALELLDHEQQAGAAVDHRVADERLGAVDDLGHVAEAQVPATAPRERHLGEVGRRPERLDVPDGEPLVGRLEEPAGPDHVGVGEEQDARVEGVGGRLHHAVQRDAVLAQLGRVRLDLDLLEPLAPDGDVGDAGDAEQPRPDLPVGGHRQVHQAHGLRRQADLHDAARRRDRGHQERRSGPRRQCRKHGLHALGDQLPCLEQVGAPLEPQLDVVELGDGLRADRVHSGDAVERVLEGDADELLDLRRRQAQARGLDRHDRRRELGEDVDLLVTDLRGAEEDQRRGERHHQVAELQA